MDGVWYDTGKSYMDDPQYMNDYVATGMKTMFFQGVQYQQHYVEDGVKEQFSSSSLKKYMDMANTAGVKKGIIIDWRIYLLSNQKVSSLYKTDDLVGRAWQYQKPSDDRQLEIVTQLEFDGTFQFETKSEFYNFIACCIKEYDVHPIFSGIIIKDEPSYEYFNVSAEIFKAVKAYNSAIRVVQNLFPMYADKAFLAENASSKTQEQCYTEYLTTWLNKTGADYIMFDSYPIKTGEIEEWHLKGLKLSAEICEANNAELCLLMQTTSMVFDGNIVYRQCQEADLYWQTNMALGYGADKIIYYTYFTPAINESDNGHIDGSAFMNNNGEKTDLYHTMTTIMSEIDAFAPVIRNFDYNASATINYEVAVDYDYDVNDTFEKLSSVYVQKGDLALVTELKDTAKGNYLYMVQNILDPSVYGNEKVSADLSFSSEYTYVAVYSKGQVSYHLLDNGAFNVQLTPGQAVFIMPY